MKIFCNKIKQNVIVAEKKICQDYTITRPAGCCKSSTEFSDLIYIKKLLKRLFSSKVKSFFF